MGKKTTGATPAPKPDAARAGWRASQSGSAEPGRQIGSRTLGPVSDLERHLPSDWWRTLFNSLYLETDGDVIENDRNTADEVDLLMRSIGLERNDRILDLCCGQGRHSLELARRGFPHVTGLDRSRYLIRLARKRARQRNLAVVVSRRGCAAVPARRRRVPLRLHPRQFVRLFRTRRGRSRRPRIGEEGPRLRRFVGHGSDGRRLDAPPFRAPLLGMDRPEPFCLPRTGPRRRRRPPDQPRGGRACRAGGDRRSVLCGTALFEGAAGGAADRRRFRQCPLSFARRARFPAQAGSRHGGPQAVRYRRGAATGPPVAAPRGAVLGNHRAARRPAAARSGQAQRALQSGGRRDDRPAEGGAARAAGAIAFAFSTTMPR